MIVNCENIKLTYSILKRFHQALQSLSKTPIAFLVRRIMVDKYSKPYLAMKGVM
jgi:hypothetical protein